MTENGSERGNGPRPFSRCDKDAKGDFGGGSATEWSARAMSISFERSFAPAVLELISTEHEPVLIDLVHYLRTHYELNTSLEVSVDHERANVLLIGFETRPVKFFVSREFLTDYRANDLCFHLDNRWFLGALIHSCSDKEMVVLNADAVEKFAGTVIDKCGMATSTGRRRQRPAMAARS